MKAALFAGLILVMPATLAAQPTLEPMDANALDAQRGGLQTPFGMDIGFGATVRTTVDGQLALQTQLTWTEKGVVTTSTGGLPSGPANPTSWSATLPGAAGGYTTVTHDLASDRIASLVINTANNRDIRQDTNITLNLPQLSALQNQVGVDRIAANLQNALGLATRSAK